MAANSGRRVLSGAPPRQRRRARAERRAVAFFKVIENADRLSIRKTIRKFQLRRATVDDWALALLDNRQLMRQERWRFAVVNFIVQCLPRTFPLLKKVLNNYNSPFWHEVQFTTLNWLVRSTFNRSEQRKILALVENNLMNVKSEAGSAAWKAGDLLGDEWFAADTVKILEKVVLTAPYVAGRKGAVHGIAHALEESDEGGRRRLYALLRRVVSEDRSAEVRSYANYTYEQGGCMRGKKRVRR